MKKYFNSILVMALFAVGFAASGEDESSSSSTSSEPQTEQKQETEAEQEIEKKEESVPEEFFEKGYEYNASYRVNRKKGYGISCNYTHKIKIYNDGTTEIISSIEGDEGGGYDPKLTSCKIEKKSESYRDVAATWYEVKWNNKKEKIYVDESGNIIWLHVNGSDKTIQEAIATRDCIFGNFTKRPMSASSTFVCKTCGEEYNPDKEFIVSEEYCYLDYPQICQYCHKHFTARNEGSGSSVRVCTKCHKRKQAVSIYESVTGRKVN